MILVTLGTQDKDFSRLLKAVEKQIKKGNIKDRVVAQIGTTKYSSELIETFDLIPLDQFDALMNECDILITHGGVGSILTGLKNNKKVIAAARLAKYKEHVNDHQLQIINKFVHEGYILELKDFDKLDKVLKKVPGFKPKAYKSNNENFVKLIEDYIDNL
jgi:UDP-N-acetylglucosamine transferase subunit ALG13